VRNNKPAASDHIKMIKWDAQLALVCNLIQSLTRICINMAQKNLEPVARLGPVFGSSNSTLLVPKNSRYRCCRYQSSTTFRFSMHDQSPFSQSRGTWFLSSSSTFNGTAGLLATASSPGYLFGNLHDPMVAMRIAQNICLRPRKCCSAGARNPLTRRGSARCQQPSAGGRVGLRRRGHGARCRDVRCSTIV